MFRQDFFREKRNKSLRSSNAPTERSHSFPSTDQYFNYHIHIRVYSPFFKKNQTKNESFEVRRIGDMKKHSKNNAFPTWTKRGFSLTSSLGSFAENEHFENEQIFFIRRQNARFEE